MSGKADKSRANVKMDLGDDAKKFFDNATSWLQKLGADEKESTEVPEVPAVPEEVTEAPEAVDDDEATDEKISMLAMSGKADKSRANVKMDLGDDAKKFFDNATSWLQKLGADEKESMEVPEVPAVEESPEVAEATEAPEATD